MKLIEVLGKLTELDDKIEIVSSSGQRLMVADSGNIPVRYLQCECSNIKINDHFTFTII